MYRMYREIQNLDQNLPEVLKLLQNFSLSESSRMILNFYKNFLQKAHAIYRTEISLGPVGVLHAQETTLTLSVMYLSPLMPKVYLLVDLLSKLHVTFILQWIAFIFGRDKEEDQKAYHVQERQLSLSSLCTYLLGSRNLRQAITPILFEII